MLPFLRNLYACLRTFQPPPHQHVCDFARSHVAVRPDGSMLVACAVNGCGVTMAIGHDIAQYFAVERETAR